MNGFDQDVPESGLTVIFDRTGERWPGLERERVTARLLDVLLNMSHWALQYHVVEWTADNGTVWRQQGDYYLLMRLAENEQFRQGRPDPDRQGHDPDGGREETVGQIQTGDAAVPHLPG